jgi:tetratricopeptide (TPR) repeat protein
VKVRHQFRLIAALAVTLVGGIPDSAASQLVRGANTNAPMLVVVTFKSADKRTGVDFAETVRDRVTGDVSYRDLQVQTKQNIDATLQASGYDMTAALTEGDANLLAKQLRADEYIEGTINKNAAGTGYTSEAWMVLTLDPNFVQPLGTFDATKLGDVAGQISKAYQAAHKAYDDVQKCRNSRRENKFAEAMSAASAGIAKYPKSTMLRICQMASLADAKKPPADVLKVAQEILQIDPKSKSALQAEVDAYDQLGNKDKKIETLASLLAADPTNTKLQQVVVYELAASGKYDVALKIIRKAVEDNPGDVVFNKLYWQLLYAVKDYKTMTAVGAAMVQIDTSFADTTYFDRTIEAFRSDTAWAKAADAAAHATQKYPRRADYWAQRGQLQLKAGQVQPAVVSLKRALEIDPKTPGARLLIITSLVDAAQYDSALAAMREALVAGEDANTIATTANTIGNRWFKFINDTLNKQKTIPNYQKVIYYATFGDSVAKDRAVKNNAKFLMGVAHYFISTLMIGDVQAQKSCEGAKQLKDVLVNAQLELPIGGATSPDLVKQLMPIVGQLDGTADQMIKVYCAPPKKPEAGGKKP